MSSAGNQCTVRIAQIAPRFGDLEANLEEHLEIIECARADGVELLVFPELSLCGYFLRDLTSEMALRLEDAKVRVLIEAARGISLVFGLVELGRGHQFYNSAVFAEDGRILGRHRKVYLPTYGLFEESRYFAAGASFEPLVSHLGSFGLLICEDMWHFSSAWLYYLDRCDVLICISAAPGRGVSEERSEVSSGRLWESLLVSQSLFFQTWSIYCNRVGFEDGVLFWGGSRVISPFGRPVAGLTGLDPGEVDANLAEETLRRARILHPLRRDEKTLLIARELERRLRDGGPEDQL